jgi:hypothetical protein
MNYVMQLFTDHVCLMLDTEHAKKCGVAEGGRTLAIDAIKPVGGGV